MQADPDPGLVESVDAFVADLQSRLNRLVTEVADDRVAADRLFVVTGHLQASLRSAEAHIAAIRDRVGGGSG